MATNVSVEGRKILSQVANGTTFEPKDPVHLLPKGEPGADWHKNDTSQLTNGTATIHNRGGQIAHMDSALSPGQHGPATHPAGGLFSRIWNGKNNMRSNQSGTTWWEKSAAVMHNTITGTAAFLSGVPGMVKQTIANMEKIVGGLTAEQLQAALKGKSDEMLEYLKSSEGMQDLALSLGLGAAMAIPGVNVVASAVGGAQRVAGIAETMNEAGAGLQAALEGATGNMSPEQIKAAQEKLARVLADLGVDGLARLLGKKSFNKRGASSTSHDNHARPPAKVAEAQPANAKSNCACALGPPVIIATGEKMLDQSDFTLPGPIPLAWRRRYRSGDARTDGWFGQGWSHPLATELWLQAQQLQYFDAQGRAVALPLLDVGQEHFEAYEQFTIARPQEHHWELRFTSGQTHHFQRPASGQWRLALCAISDRNGNRIQLQFAQADFGEDFDAFATPPRPVRLIDSAGRVLQLHWNPERQLTAVQVRDAMQASGDASLAPIALAHYSYAADPLEPAGLPNLAQQTNPAGQQRSFEWKRHLLVGYTLASGQRHRNQYDQGDADLGPTARVTLSQNIDDGIGNQFAYQARHTWARDQLGRITGFEHDERQDIVAVTDAAGHTSRTPFDANGHPKGSVDALRRSTSTVFDRRGNLTLLIDAAGNQTKIAYNALDLPAELTDAMGGIWCRQYDARGNLITSTDPLGQSTHYEVDATGQVIAIMDAAGRRKTLRWDGQGNLIAYTDCSGQTTRFAYDALGHLAHSTDALQQTTHYQFDPLGRLQQVTQPDQAVHRYQWDGEGNLTQYTDPLGQTTRWRSNGAGDPLDRVDALGQRIAYHYDAAGRLSTLTNENDARTTFGYDLLDRLTDEIGFDGRHQRYGYNAAGELTHLIEAGGSDLGPGKVTRFERDALGRLTAKTHEGTAGAAQSPFEPWKLPFHEALAQIERHAGPAPGENGAMGDAANARFSYDKLGRLTQAANAVSTVQFAYDPLGQLLAETQTLTLPTAAGPADPKTFQFAHHYDPLGNRIQTTLPSGQKLNQLFYGSGHLHQINLDGQVVSDFERDALHRETQRSQGPLASQFAYDPAGRLKAQRVLPGASAQAASASWAGLSGPQRQGIRSLDTLRSASQGLIERHYEYDPGGQLRNILDRHRGLNHYGYDAIGRITASQIGRGKQWAGLASPPAGTQPLAADENFHWDAASNPVPAPLPGGARGHTSTSAVPDNRLRMWQDALYAYDVHGNLTGRLQGKRNSAAQTTTWFAWDAAHQLIQATVVRGTEDSGGQTTQTYRYAYDALGRRIAKTDAFATTVFACDGDQLHAEQRGGNQTQYLYQPRSFVPLAQIHDGALHHLHTDHLGTPMEASNDAGQITWRVTYRTWGNVLVKEEEQITQNLRFQGQYFDAETGLHYNRFRYYDPGVGRFVSQDPIGLMGGMNIFTYVPNPIHWVDPRGLAAAGQLGTYASLNGGTNVGDNLGAHELIRHEALVQMGCASKRSRMDDNPSIALGKVCTNRLSMCSSADTLGKS